jgi:hypothetical protein
MRLERITVAECKNNGTVVLHKGWQIKSNEDPQRKAERLAKLKERLK